MATPEQSKRFHAATVAALKDIDERAMPLPDQEHYKAAYGILKGYFETVLTIFAASFSQEQLTEVRSVLDQLRKLVKEDAYIAEADREKLDQQAQALRESE